MKITTCTYYFDGDEHVTYDVAAAIENKTEYTVELVKTSLLLINSDGICTAGQSDQEHDVFIDAGDSDSIDTSMWITEGPNRVLYDGKDKTKLSLDAALFRREFSKLGELDIPDDHTTVALLNKTIELNSGDIKIYGACLKKGKPEDGEATLTATVGVRNVSDKYIEQVSVKMVLIDQEDAILDETTDITSIAPNLGSVIESSIWGKEGRLRNCKIRLGVSVYSPIGALSAQAAPTKEKR